MFFNGVQRTPSILSAMNAVKSLLKSSPAVNNQMVRCIKLSPIRLIDPPKINATHRVDNLEKRFLVWTGKYKRIEDVPQLVPPDVMERSRNIMRIRIANLMMLLTLLGCLAMVWSGKKARARGESVEKMNLRWHEQIQQQEEAAKRSQ